MGPLVVLLYLAEVLNYGTGELPIGEPCKLQEPNSYEWFAFTWDAHRLRGVDEYSTGRLRQHSVLRGSGTKIDRIEVGQAPFDHPDFIFTIAWANGVPTKMVRENAPNGHVTAARTVWTFEWSSDRRSARIREEQGRMTPTVRTARFDAAGQLLSVSLSDDPNDRFRAELSWSNGRLVAQRTYYGAHTFTYDDRGRIATRSTTMGPERYLYDCR